jgi:predicted transcriptional regulator
VESREPLFAHRTHIRQKASCPCTREYTELYPNLQKEAHFKIHLVYFYLKSAFEKRDYGLFLDNCFIRDNVVERYTFLKQNSDFEMIEETREDNLDSSDLLRMTTDIVSAYLGNNAVAASQIPEIINSVHEAFTRLTTDDNEPEVEPAKPAVSIRRSITPDYIICLEDGKRLKMLKRHLRTTYNMTPEDYRSKWGLPSDYPMVAPNYTAQRSEFAKKIGLGRKAVKRAGRKRKTA